jgi:hypothetical protein
VALISAAPLSVQPARLLLAAAFVAALTANAWLRPADAPGPSTIAAALARLSERGEKFHVYLQDATGGDLEAGVFLCAEPHDPAELRSLQRTAEDAPRWKGVVLLKRELHPNDVFYRQLDGWGANAVWSQPLVLFGDPELLPRASP